MQTPLLADAHPVDETTIIVTSGLNWLATQVPHLGWIILGALIFVGLGLAVVWAWLNFRKIKADAESLRRAVQAEETLILANAEGERLRLILQVASVALRRKDAIDYGAGDAPPPKDCDGTRNLCEWIVKILAIEKPDINKMTVWEPTEDGTKLRIAEFHGMNPESSRTLTFEIHPDHSDKDSFAAMAFRNDRIEICDDTQTDPRYKMVTGHPPTHPYRSIIAVPIRQGQRVVGVYTIDSREANRFSDNDQAAQQQYDLYARLFALFIAAPHGVAVDGKVNMATQPALEGK
jgi:hypothetical protein